jgi:hypothetical protein
MNMKKLLMIGDGSSSRYVFRRVGRSCWQQAKGIGGCPGFVQSSSRQEVLRHPLLEAA